MSNTKQKKQNRIPFFFNRSFRLTWEKASSLHMAIRDGRDEISRYLILNRTVNRNMSGRIRPVEPWMIGDRFHCLLPGDGRGSREDEKNGPPSLKRDGPLPGRGRVKACDPEGRPFNHKRREKSKPIQGNTP